MENGPDAPPSDSPACSPARAPRIAVLGAAADVRVVAWAVASGLSFRRCPPGVVATWSPAGEGAGRPRTGVALTGRPRAARAARALSDGGHAARAAGRLVDVVLGEGPGAVAEAERLHAAAGDGAVILALGGARGPEWDGRLQEQDLIVLAAGPRTPEALVDVALTASRERCPGVPAMVVAVTGGRRPRASRQHLATALGLLDPR